jgi:hypothetical protein
MALPDRSSRYRLAGGLYLVLGLAVVAVTIWTPELLAPERRADFAHLLVGLALIVVFALLVGFGDRIFSAPLWLFGVTPFKAEAVGRGGQTVLTMVLTLTALGRAVVFGCNAAGLRPRLSPLRLEPTEPTPRLWLAVALMLGIVYVLAHASWLPWLHDRRGR